MNNPPSDDPIKTQIVESRTLTFENHGGEKSVFAPLWSELWKLRPGQSLVVAIKGDQMKIRARLHAWLKDRRNKGDGPFPDRLKVRRTLDGRVAILRLEPPAA